MMDEFYFSKAFDYAWEKVSGLNKRIDDEKPWALAKEGKTEQVVKVLTSLVKDLLDAADLLEPFLPETAEKIN